MSDIENSIKLVSIPELLDFHFFIAEYQRGYRWTEIQVLELLEDISEFVNKKKIYMNSTAYSPLLLRK